ncbi:MAG: hypothetical protein V3T05_14195 [Myxococcota bacterium]
MWLSLTRGSKDRLTLTDQKSIWPAPDGSDAELVITTEAQLTQEVILVTPRVVRLSYTVDQIRATLTLDDGRPAPWPDAQPVKGKGFEIMITERGALVVPVQGERLQNKQAIWLDTVAEGIRSAWIVPPHDAEPGREWKLTPIMPGGLPPGTKSLDFDVSYRLQQLDGPNAHVTVVFAMKFVLDTKPQVGTGVGKGDMTVRIDRSGGVSEAHRTGRVELLRTATRHQILRSNMDLRRL